MTYREFVEVVKAWGLVTPGINDQDIYRWSYPNQPRGVSSGDKDYLALA